MVASGWCSNQTIQQTMCDVQMGYLTGLLVAMECKEECNGLQQVTHAQCEPPQCVITLGDDMMNTLCLMTHRHQTKTKNCRHKLDRRIRHVTHKLASAYEGCAHVQSKTMVAEAC